MIDNVKKIDNLIGRSVLSFATANKLGQIADLLIEPLSGELAGFVVHRLNSGGEALVSILDVRGIGPDAVMVEGDESLVLTDASPLNPLPRAKRDLAGVKVVTEKGLLLGKIASLFLWIDKRPAFIYEVRSSLLDLLLGRAFYFAASLGCAFSDDRSTIVVSGDPNEMYHRVEAAAERLLGPCGSSLHPAVAVRVEVRTHAH